MRLSSAAVSSSTSTAVPPPPPPQSSQCVVYLQNYRAPAYYKALQNSKSFLGKIHASLIIHNFAKTSLLIKDAVDVDSLSNMQETLLRFFKSSKKKNLTPTFYYILSYL